MVDRLVNVSAVAFASIDFRFELEIEALLICGVGGTENVRVECFLIDLIFPTLSFL